jgi:hypothetical protein
MVRESTFSPSSRSLQWLVSSSWVSLLTLVDPRAIRSTVPRTGEIQVFQPFQAHLTTGAFKDGFKGICSAFVTAAFAFAGTELAGLAAAETVCSILRFYLTIRKIPANLFLEHVNKCSGASLSFTSSRWPSLVHSFLTTILDLVSKAILQMPMPRLSSLQFSMREYPLSHILSTQLSSSQSFPLETHLPMLHPEPWRH